MAAQLLHPKTLGLTVVYLLGGISLELFRSRFAVVPGLGLDHFIAGFNLIFLLVFGLRYTPVLVGSILISGIWIWQLPLTAPALWLSAFLVPLGYAAAAAILRYIKFTDCARAKQALQESEQRFCRVVSSISDHIYVTGINSAGERVNHYLSDHIEPLTGYPKHKFEADWSFWPQSVIHPDDRAAAARQAAELFKGIDSEVEYRLTRADGQIIWVRDSGRAVREGDSVMIYGVVSDITERKHLENQLRQAQKMEAIGQLAGGVAHDFNNILTVISGYTELLLRRYPDPADPQREDIMLIKKASEQAANLTRQLLAFSRQQTLRPQILNLNTVVLNLERMLRRLSGENIVMRTDLEPSLGQVKADPGQIEQVLLNLALNARDAMPRGGELTIKTVNLELPDRAIEPGLDLLPGSYVALLVTDTGVGMEAEVQNRIFDPFFTTKEPGRGTGLGLSTVYGIVRQSEGYIQVESRPGQGTTFTVYLPRLGEVDPPEPAGPAPVPATNSLDSNNAKTILLVEDEASVRLITHRFLQRQGYLVLEARHPEQALELCRQHRGSLDLLITDLIMPYMNGHELAQRLLQIYPNLKVLYISGYTDDALNEQGILLPDIVFLEKPFSSADLIQKVGEALKAVPAQRVEER